MRIRKLTVESLFNLFHHEVSLNLEEHITIIHGPNGVGKTALLKLVHAFFNSQISVLKQIPFTKFKIELDDGRRVFILKDQSKRQRRQHRLSEKELIFTLTDKEGHREEYRPEQDVSSKDPRLRHLDMTFEHFVPTLDRVDVGYYRLPSGEIIGINEAIRRYEHLIPKGYREALGELEDSPGWLREIVKGISVYFIQAQRLVAVNERRQASSGAKDQGLTPSVQIYSEEVIKALKDTLAEYAELAQSLDRTFPARLVQQGRAANLSSDQLKNRLAALDRKRQALQSTGLLEDEQGVGFVMPETIDPTTQDVLSVYVEDVESKLKVFDTLADKIDLLKKIVDDRFLYKTMTISRERGFLFTNHGANLLAPTNLSSGEQNVLVLLYELLFKVKSGSLILIDEPEISLHVAWQLEFLRDLQQVIKLSEFDVLIATHSPQIINDRWDLTVKLVGPEVPTP
jgi:predicted ATP-binding protein involved in virulence